MKKINKKNYQIMTTPPNKHTQWPKSWVYVGFKMAANKIALTHLQFELGICGIIQNVFQGD